MINIRENMNTKSRNYPKTKTIEQFILGGYNVD